MRILLDENLHEGLAAAFAAHDAVHVNAIGWQGLKNGALFARTAAEGFEAFVTADKKKHALSAEHEGSAVRPHRP